MASPRRERGISLLWAPWGSLGADTASQAPTAHVVAVALPQLLAKAAGADMAWEVSRSANSSLLPRRSLVMFSLTSVDGHKISVLLLSWGFSPVGVIACGKCDAWMGWPMWCCPKATKLLWCGVAPAPHHPNRQSHWQATYSKIVCLVLHRERYLEGKNLLAVQTHKFISAFVLHNMCVWKCTVWYVCLYRTTFVF